MSVWNEHKGSPALPTLPKTEMAQGHDAPWQFLLPFVKAFKYLILDAMRNCKPTGFVNRRWTFKEQIFDSAVTKTALSKTPGSQVGA